MNNDEATADTDPPNVVVSITLAGVVLALGTEGK